MTTRRNFLNTTFLATLFPLNIFANSPKKGTKKNPHSIKGFPITIATWGKNTAAVNAAMQTIEEGKNALDAVEAGAKIPEADPNEMTVGYGGYPDIDGNVTLDACIMDEKGNAGSVTYLQNIMHPISVARRIMEKTPHVMLSGDGALQFALSEGFQKENLLTEKSKQAWEEWKKTANYKPIVNIEKHDTIGILAIDKKGNISGGCTTSGMAFKMKGRIGDSPIIGAGMFVDNEIGGACATGVGELVMKAVGSFLVVELMRQGYSPQEACEEAVNRIIKKNKDKNLKDFQVGYLAINKKGEHGAYCIQAGFDYAINQKNKTQVFESQYYIK